MHVSVVRGLRRRVGLLPLLGAVAAFAAGSAHATAGWDSTLSRAMTDGKASALMAPVASSLPMQITLTLNVTNKPALDALFKAQNTPGNPQYHKYLTPQQFAAQYAPAPAQTQAVVNYLKNAGFQNVRSSASGLLVGGTATAAQVQQAFNTRIAQFQLNGRTVYVNTQAAQVPSSLGGVVMAVGGLQNAVNWQTSIHKQQLSAAATAAPRAGATASSSCTLGPSCVPAVEASIPPTGFQKTYDVGATSDGSNTALAISTFGDDLTPGMGSTVVEDLRNAEASFGLPFVPVQVRLSTPIVTPDTSGDGEWDLDTQQASGMAGNVKALIIYAADDSVADNLLWEYAAFADAADAQVGNMSYGLCELFEDATLTTNPLGQIVFGLGVVGGLPTLQASDLFFEQAAVEGLSWHASSGDSGGYCTIGNVQALPGTGVPGGANYPTSSPYVVSVGGTSLLTTDDYTYIAEYAWPEGGGGISVVEPAPSWQSGVVPSSGLGAAGAGRGVPDVAMFAGTGFAAASTYGGLIYSAGSAGEGNTAYLGTSLSSPLAAGTWARFQTAHCNSLGFAAPDYYALLGSTLGLPILPSAAGFNDIVLGTNSFYPASLGWDYATGLGSIDVAKVGAQLGVQFPLPAGCGALPPAPVIASVDQNTGSSSASAAIQVFPVAGGDPVSYYVVDFGDGVPGAVGTGASSTQTQAPNPDVAVQPTVPWPNQVCASSASGPAPAAGGGSSSCIAPFTGNPALFSHTYPATGTYTVRAWARNAHGVVSQPVSFTVKPGTPTAPIRPSGLVAAAVKGQIMLSWSAAPGATSYALYQGTKAGGEITSAAAYSGSATSATLYNRTGGTTYYYVVKAINATGTSATSNETSVTLPLPPATPTGLTAVPGNTQATLSWKAAAGADTYKVLVGTTSGGENNPLATGVTGTSAVITGLRNGATYYFVVESVSGGGTSAPSNEAKAALPATPAAPTGVTAATGGAKGSIVVSWTAPAGAASYNVYVGTRSDGESASPVLSGVKGTSATINGLSTGGTYFVQVTAVSSTGAESNKSAESNAAAK